MANVKRQQQLREVFGDIGLAASVPAASNLKHNCRYHWIIDVAIGPLSKWVGKWSTVTPRARPCVSVNAIRARYAHNAVPTSEGPVSFSM